MTKWMKTALILLLAGAILFVAGSMLGGKGISINQNFKVIDSNDYIYFTYTNMKLDEFEAVDIDVSNTPVTFLPSEDGGYGVEVSYRIVNENDIRVEVDKQKLIVEAKEKMFWMSWDFSFMAENENKEYIIVYLPEKEYKEITVDTSNAAVTLKKVTAPAIEIDTSNGSIEILDSDVQKLVADTSNASITMKESRLSSERGEISLITSNGEIRVDFSENKEKEFKINADTSNADIYLNNQKLEKNDYATREGAVSLKLDTSNSDIIMNFKE
ncbi:MAG: DUF4097 family beta strand repeat-containing protein [Thermoflexaceae bacterium]|nr:DUF4097 family beta strand repeat-containing protein [Thermoflexaceae bacterium]